MSIQFASNELHRAFILTDGGRYIEAAEVALSAKKMALDSRSRHAVAIAERASQHIESLPARLEINGVSDQSIYERAASIIEESRLAA